jgi:hypothetical protein
MRIFTSLIVSLAMLAIAACGKPSAPLLGALEPLDVTTADNVSGPRLSSGPDGRLTLSWMERRDDTAVLSFATLAEGGFSDPTTVATEGRMFVNWADLPSVLHVAGDHWVAHWLGYSADKTYSYDVVLAQSFDNGESWSAPMKTHTDGTQTEHGFVSMYRATDGVGLIWLDGRATPYKPMTLRTAVVSPEGERIHEQEIDASVCDCCQTDVAVSSLGPIAVYRARTEDEIRDIFVTRHDGERWHPGERLYADNWEIPGCPVNGPSIVADGDEVAVAWFSAADNKPVVRLVRSADGGRTFADPLVIAAGSLSGWVGLAQLTAEHVAVSWVSRDEQGINTLHVAVTGANNEIVAAGTVADITQLRVFPQLGFQDNHLVLAWTDEIDDRRVLRAARYPVALP